MIKNILNEFKKIEYDFLNINPESEHSKFFYNFIEINEIFIFKIFNCLKLKNNKKKILKYINYIDSFSNLNINYKNMKIITSKEIYVILIISISIAWSFNETSDIKNIIKENNKDLDNKLFTLSHDSYSVINECRKFINSYKIWVLSINGIAGLSTNLTEKDYNSMIFKILSILCSNNIIEFETNYFQWLKKKKINYSSIFFVKKRMLKVFNNPLKIKKINKYSFLFGDHYSFYWDMYIPNTESNAIINFKDEEIIINSMSNIYTNVDFNFLNNFYLLYLKEENLDKENLENLYNLLIKELKNTIKYSNKELMSKISKQLAIIQKALDLDFLINQNFKNDTKFYLPWKHDFRGRTYFFSDISFTFIKEFRWCMYIGYHKDLNDLIPKWHPYNNRIYEILDDCIEDLKQLNLKIKNDENIFVKYTLIFILISLAEINKTKLGVIVDIKEFIKEGIFIYNNNDISKYKYDDKIKILALKETIKDFENDFNEGKVKKRLISKDAPASVFQHLVLNFGWKNENLLTWCNLNSKRKWYDTYSYLIDEWKKRYNNDLDKKNLINIFFTRETVKKAIMTSNYGISEKSARKDYQKILKNLSEKDVKKNLLEIYEKNNIILEEIFKDFFDFISKLELFEKSSLEIENFILKENGYIKLKDAIVDAKYYVKGDSYIIDFQNKGTRYTKYYDILTEEIDDKKFRISIRANYIQSLDAALMRWIIIKKPVYTIHDCFLIEYNEIIYFLSLINEGMNEKFHDFYKTWEKEKKEIFSIFIVL